MAALWASPWSTASHLPRRPAPTRPSRPCPASSPPSPRLLSFYPSQHSQCASTASHCHRRRRRACTTRCAAGDRLGSSAAGPRIPTSASFAYSSFGTSSASLTSCYASTVPCPLCNAFGFSAVSSSQALALAIVFASALTPLTVAAVAAVNNGTATGRRPRRRPRPHRPCRRHRHHRLLPTHRGSSRPYWRSLSASASLSRALMHTSTPLDHPRPSSSGRTSPQSLAQPRPTCPCRTLHPHPLSRAAHHRRFPSMPFWEMLRNLQRLRMDTSRLCTIATPLTSTLRR